MLGHANDLLVVDASPDHHVHLDRREPGAPRRIDALQHGADRHVGIAHAPEGLIGQAVQADCDARQAGIPERLRQPRQQHAIGGQRDLHRFPRRRMQPGEHFDELFDVASQQRLAAGQSYLLHAQRDKGSCQPRDLLEAEQFGARQKLVILVENCTRHAVCAAQVAAVSDGDAQIAQRALQRIDYHRSILLHPAWHCPVKDHSMTS